MAKHHRVLPPWVLGSWASVDDKLRPLGRRGWSGGANVEKGRWGARQGRGAPARPGLGPAVGAHDRPQHQQPPVPRIRAGHQEGKLVPPVTGPEREG